MKRYLHKLYIDQLFFPNKVLGLLVNPFYIIRRGLLNGSEMIAEKFIGGKLLDIGCGSKPYEKIFNVEKYIGIDIEHSGHNHELSKVDKFYDGKNIPFEDAEFDWVFSSEVFEHVFNLDEVIDEINRVLKPGGKIGFTCPFVWDEHEQPHDYARYTSFAIAHLMEKHGFKVEVLDKSTSYFPTIMQMLSAYVWQYCLPKNRVVRALLTPILVTPINIVGIVLGSILPKNYDFYHNNIVIAVKVEKLEYPFAR